MPFIPHTENDVKTMLAAIGVDSIEALFDEIPAELRARGLDNIPAGMNEMAVGRLMQQRAAEDGQPLCFIGAGAYEHHIPAAVWEIVTRGEFYSAYTPYQAEASQGTLQLVYEFQTMIAGLNALDVSNASLYDGASALAEAVLMAVRANRKSKSKRILMPRSVHPDYRKVVHTIVHNQGIELVELPLGEQGHTDPASLAAFAGEDIAALVVPQPNFFGVLEEVDALTDWAHANGALVIGLVNPTALALLAPPGEWGEKGADIACGEGQPLGSPLASGGPWFGFMACKQAHVRQMPGRIVGRTVDLDGNSGFTLTLQAREQHIRRSKATSNICTNQGLLAAAATIYMALLGPSGLERVAAASHNNTRALVEKLIAIDGVELVFDRPYFHEALLRINRPVDEVLRALAVQDLLGGYHVVREYPELENCLLVCATETRSEADIESYTGHMERILSAATTSRPAPN
ncbi:MAG: aminomethyl-transferring glycine dehydrogenase subunit GcvPA [Gammaproteobacteria bacterium]|nr:aminomethyl-transferring glycine dehydrogenase subunit GcvPA [Gammaproteobacteria bacterium]MCW8972700.1 aminomethyl-transferring glycine dehydrogenase subunit GcvPA [Gammaproteobacteria bacterium]MCW8992335.1 aminomethyl-transferring glycine dehydrogenase subunit GcvPA [Gammaproteobacteria bacterium]